MRDVRTARHILLDRSAEPGVVRFLTGLENIRLEEGKKTGWVTVTRTGAFSDPRYGDFTISGEMLAAMVKNFAARVLGQDVFVDVSHRPQDGAAGKMLELRVEGDRLRALVEWTPFGVEAVKTRGFAYLSAEYHENWQDNEQGLRHGPTLLGAGLTVRPVIKGLEPVLLAHPAEDVTPTLIHPSLAATLKSEIHTMWEKLLSQLLAMLGTFKLAEEVKTSLVDAARKALAAVTDEAAARTLIASFEATGKSLAEQIGDKVVQLSIAAPTLDAKLLADEVSRQLAALRTREDEEAKQAADKKTARLKLLTETIGAASGLDEGAKKELADAVSDLVSAEMSEDQVRRLAAAQIQQGHKLAAAKKLATMGWRPNGAVHIEVGQPGEILALQEEMDRRVVTGAYAHGRFTNTGGTLQAVNKDVAEKILAAFDAENAPRLLAEHKAWKERGTISLAAGTGSVSDIAIPAIFERTVIREALYDLVGLSFVDAGPASFSAVLQLPYSYRDTSGAGIDSIRIYEGQGIGNASIIQTSEDARPIPQKLGFKISEEMRLLAANGQLDFDAVAENSRNAARIVGEDTDRLLFNEHVRSADEFGAVAVVSEALTGVNGTNRIFVLANFPVVRPRVVRDLKGVQVGSTTNPITVTYAAVVRDEYDGTGTQAAGTYWVMDYNLGEIRFVTQLGVAVVPPNATAITVSYSHSTNAARFDTDLGSLTTDAKWDAFLYAYGQRKTVIEDQRYYMANFALMSGTLRNQIEQARQFAANYARAGTSLATDGNLGRIKDVPNFKTVAPGLFLGDTRLVMGQRNQVRMRMMKPWAMTELQPARNGSGQFTAQQETYGTQWIVVHTPTQLKRALTSVVIYSATGRVNRA